MSLYFLTPEPKPIKAVLFDLDGTLIDTAADFVRLIQDWCGQLNRTAPSADAIRSQVSEGANAMLRLAFPELAEDRAELDVKRQFFLTEYEATIGQEAFLFDGLNDFLLMLEQHNIPWGIVTNKPDWLSRRLLENINLHQRCSVLICPEQVSVTKPDPEGVLKAASVLGVQPNEVVYVGDHVRDIEAGKRANMATLAALYGYIDPNDTLAQYGWHADISIQRSEDIHSVFRFKH